jgi:acyl-CoA synthetase (AMP-forming)/AMP-acid ligase II
LPRPRRSGRLRGASKPVQMPHAETVPEQLREHYLTAGHWNALALRDGVEAVAASTPDRVAVIEDGTVWTYRALEEHVGSAVRYLRARGIGPGTAVVVVAPIATVSVVAFLAALRAGGVAMMLDRRCGPADVDLAAGHDGVRLVLSTGEFAARTDLARAGRPVADLDDLLAATEPDRDWGEPDPEQPAAVLFTSGSTSRPKGVVHSLNTLRAGGFSWGHPLRAGRDDITYVGSPLASITGLIQTLRMLESGGALLLDDHFAPAASLARLCAHGASLIGSPPIIVEELIRQAVAEDRQELPVRAIAVGGAMIPRPLLQLALDRYGIRPIRMYGSSEVPSAAATAPSDEGEARLADEGVPAPGAELRVDSDGPGELLVRGPMRFLGYLDPEHNADAFAPGGWYRTGDLARFDGGRLTITGRIKEMVSRKGLKISLMEVDAQAARLPGVAEVAAYGVPDEATGERLVLAVRFEGNGLTRDWQGEDPHVAMDRLVGGLRAAGLATWKLPEQIVVWAQPMPRTPTGKVARRLVADDATERPTALAPRLRGHPHPIWSDARSHPRLPGKEPP